jgi:hypothetical protein
MGLQDQLSVETPLSVGIMQNIQVTGGTGTYITSTITKRKGMLVVSYDTSGGLTQWHTYVYDDVNLVWVDTTLPAHKHSGAADGGDFYEVDVEGVNANRCFFNAQHPVKALFGGQAFAGTAAAINDTVSTVGRIDLVTGTTTTGYANIFTYGALPVSFASRFRLNVTFKLSAITNILWRWGMGVEDINGVSDNLDKVGMEWCDAQPSSQYYTLSANGTTRSLVTTGIALDASTGHGFRIVYFPASKAQYTFDDGTIYDKTAVLPSGACLDENIFRIGAKNNNGGSATRTLEVRGVYYVGRTIDAKWVDS